MFPIFQEDQKFIPWYFSGKVLSKCNPPDFKFYRCYPYGVMKKMSIFGFYSVNYKENRYKINVILYEENFY